MQDYWSLKRKDTDEEMRFTQRMQWIDEKDWSELAQADPKRTVTGANVTQQGKRLGGRAITLSTSEYAWLEKREFLMLQAWSGVPKLVMKLTHYNGTEYDVYFRNHEGAVDYEPVMYEVPEADDAAYVGEIRLITTTVTNDN